MAELRIFDEKNKEEIKLVSYREIPIMYTNRNTLLCFPSKKETRDLQTVAIVGVKRAGKSLMMHFLTDMIFNQTNDAIFNANDWTDETLTYSLPNTSKLFSGKLASLNLEPRPLPMVYVYPYLSKLFSMPENLASIRTSIPLDDVMDSATFLASEKERTRKGSFKRLPQIKEMLVEEYRKPLNKLTLPEVMEVLNKKFHAKRDHGMRDLLTTAFYNLFTEKIVDPTGEFPSSLEVNGRNFPPITAIMSAGLIPSLMTFHLKTKPFWASYIKNRLEEVFIAKREGIFKEREQSVWITMDEMKILDSHKHTTDASEIIRSLASRGGPLGLGFIWAQQDFSQAHEEIKENTPYVISFKTSADQATEIGRYMGGLTKSQNMYLRNQRKYQCVAMTNNFFIEYDLLTGERRKVERKFIEGWVIPPLSYHKPPEGFSMPNRNIIYAADWLRYKGLILRNPNNQKNFFYTYSKTVKIYKKLNTAIECNKDLLTLFGGRNVPLQHEIDYSELKGYGFDIYSIPLSPAARRYYGIKSGYRLYKTESDKPREAGYLNYLPPGLRIMLDVRENMVALDGPNIMKKDWRRIRND